MARGVNYRNHTPDRQPRAIPTADPEQFGRDSWLPGDDGGPGEMIEPPEEFAPGGGFVDLDEWRAPQNGGSNNNQPATDSGGFGGLGLLALAAGAVGLLFVLGGS